VVKVSLSGLTYLGRQEMERLNQLGKSNHQERLFGHAFISYSVVDKKWGGAIRRGLESLGLTAFIAHDDLRVSEEWKVRIIEEMGRADVFVALLSKHFKESEWCPQELGFTVPFPDVLVIPLSVDDTRPFGFIGHLQGHRLSSEQEVETALLDVLLRRRPRLIIPKIIMKLASVGGFRTAEATMKPLVPYFSVFSPQEASDFAFACSSNRQVWDAGECRLDFLPQFLKLWGTRLSDAVRIDLKRKIGDHPAAKMLLHPYGNTNPPSPPRPRDEAVANAVLEQALDLGIGVTRIQLEPDDRMTVSIIDDDIATGDRDILVTVARGHSYEIEFKLGGSDSYSSQES